MAAGGWIFLLAAMVSLKITLGHNHSGGTDTYHVSVGHLFLLRCLFADAHTSVTWSRGGGYNLPTGVEVRDGLLWFLPVQMSHNGLYTCEKRDKNGLSSRVTYGVSVSSAECPETLETVPITDGGLPCKQTEIFKLNNTRNIRWMKDCQPVEKPISLGKNGFMRLSSATERDAGKYTCLVDVSVDGRKYTAARSIQLTTGQCSLFDEPKVVFPQREVVVVKKYQSAELNCLALIGHCEDNETVMYWTVGEAYVEDHKELNETSKFTSDRGRVYGQSTLSIPKVLPQFLNVPISCYVSNSAGSGVGVVWLQEADHSALYTSLALCLATSLAVLALAAAFLFFKVDLVLVHRKLLRRFSKQQALDGKFYDAYVSFLQPNTLSSADTESFALQILPEELERKHGYSLYIRGRDDCPGEAVHDVIATTVRQCRRLIIILSPTIKSSTDTTTEDSLLHDNQNQLCYEQKVGLYDALTQNDPRVILVEIGSPVDYGVLPESLRYIKRKQGALKWKKASLRTHKLPKLHSNRSFWKNLRYHMPSVPSRRLQTIV
ncbi:interleukin-1 receptor type 1 [Centropristis striata]|uniref:interleukin-1 receptor type 1 n=1 Tax=Centropristis striata TaxID=184440 RepID=UPI0027E1B415|nr:interleukin-1 receptor type 1 [Centropristis striata]XP_059198206.1 interleukin-1 receptor type 1 [Centropristis striata]